MHNYYLTQKVKIKDIKQEAEGVKLFTLSFYNKKDAQNFDPLPGQFVEIGIPGFGEGPFVVCFCSDKRDSFQICARKIGRLTNKFHTLNIGDIITVRGPYGLGIFPKIKKNLLLIAGGMGLVPLRPIIHLKIRELIDIPNSDVAGLQLFYGVRSQKDMLFKDEYEEWGKYIDFNAILDNKEKGWQGPVGLVTDLFKNVDLIKDSVAILCGPPIMYKFVLRELKKLKFKDKDIYMSLERRMQCGVGVCQHCAIGEKYVCKDGPVFCWDDIKNIKGVI